MKNDLSSGNGHGDSASGRKILSSWKEIASHMGRGVRTVQRYEALGLPVIRVHCRPRSSVAAFAEEINAWIETRAVRSKAAVVPIPREEWEVMLSETSRLRTEVQELRAIVDRLHTRDRELLIA